MAGAAVLAGLGGAVTVAVLADVADAEPPALVAVTTTSTVSPTSAATSVYAEPVAPLMFAHDDAHRCH